MARLGNNGEVDLPNDPAILNAQVRIIQQCKHIRDPMDLKDKTGVNNDYIRYVLQNKNEIIKKWKRFCRHADDCDGIDALLLKYISHCKERKVKPTVPMVMSEVDNLLKVLKVHPYNIKPYIWTIIGHIPFNKLNVIEPTTNKSIQLYSLFDILVEDGRRLLQPETHKRFLKSIETIEENSCASVARVDADKCSQTNIKVSIMNQRKTISKRKKDKMKKSSIEAADSNRLLDVEKNSIKSSSTSSDDIPPLKSISLTSENKDTEFLQIKEEPLDYTDYEANTNNNLSTQLIKTEITDDYEKVIADQDAFIDFYREPLIKTVFSENNGIKLTIVTNIESSGSDPPAVQMKSLNHTYKSCSDSQGKNANDDKEIKIELSENSCQQTKIDANCNILEVTGNKDNVQYDENDEIVLEIEDCDNETHEEFLEAINKYIEEGSMASEQDVKIVESNVKQEPIESESDEDDDGEVVRILEIISDDEDDDDDDIKIKKELISNPESFIEYKTNLKRSRNAIEDDSFSISHSSCGFTKIHW